MLIIQSPNAMQCNAMQCNAMQCNAMQCNAMQRNFQRNLQGKRILLPESTKKCFDIGDIERLFSQCCCSASAIGSRPGQSARTTGQNPHHKVTSCIQTSVVRACF